MYISEAYKCWCCYAFDTCYISAHPVSSPQALVLCKENVYNIKLDTYICTGMADIRKLQLNYV